MAVYFFPMETAEVNENRWTIVTSMEEKLGIFAILL